VLKIGVKVPPLTTRLGDLVADVTAVEAAGADSIWIEARDENLAELLLLAGAIMAVTHRLRLGLIASSPVQPLRNFESALDAIHTLSRGRGLGALRSDHDRQSTLLVATGRWPGEDGPPEVWAEAEIGQDRAAWRQAIETHSSAGHAGLVVAWDPRIVDLLRNPDLEDDRSDLLMSTG
jgi:hypothetical protein